MRVVSRPPVQPAIREATATDLPFLRRMLYEAANRPGTDWPDFETSMNDPRNRRFWSVWPREGDLGVVAETTGEPAAAVIPIRAAWIRRLRDDELSEFDDPAIPVLVIGIEREIWSSRSTTATRRRP